MSARRITKNVFVTGPPRCGKSTLIAKLIDRIDGPISGFFTRQMEERGRRIGFSILTLDGKQGVLAHESLRSRFRVGKYGVNLKDIDNIAVPSMLPDDPNALVVIDEVGKMECFSVLFKKNLIKILDSEHPVIGSISLKGDRFIQRIKARDDVLLVEVTEENRNSEAFQAGLLKAFN